MQRKNKLILACALVAVTAFGMGASLQATPVVKAETNTDAILYYDFSAETIGEDVDGYSTVKNLGTKTGANATIFNGTGLNVSERLVFNQPKATTYAENEAKGNFELPVGAFSGLSAFTLQMEVNMNDGFADREPLFAMLPKPGAYHYAENAGQGIIFGDGWLGNGDYTFLDGFYSTSPNAGWQIVQNGDRPLTWAEDFLVTFMFDGSKLSVYFNEKEYLSVQHSDASLFAHYKYFRIGGLLYDWNGALQATVDDVKLYDYARSTAQLTADSNAFKASITSVDAKRAKIYYDFARADENGVVENMGTGVNMDGRIVETKDDVNISNGKLVINNAGTIDTNNGYFRLPDNMFAGTRNWSMVMNVDHFDLHGDQATSFLFFGEDNPAVNQPENFSNTQISFNWDGQIMAPFYQATTYNPAGNSVAWGQATTAMTDPVTEEKTIALIYKNRIATLYYGGKAICSSNVAAAYNYYWGMDFNKIGGYIFNWGRSSSDISIDSFAFFDYAIDTSIITNYYAFVESATATLPETATTIADANCRCYIRTGQGVNRTGLIFPENIDFKTVGNKEYIIWRNNQYTPIRFTLTTTHVDTNNDNECDSCGEIVDGIGKAYGINLGLNGTISANIFMELTEETIADTGAYMRTQYGDKTFEIPVQDAEVRDGYYVFSVEVPAKEIDSEITSYIVCSNEKTGVVYTYSVKEYAEKMMETDPTTETLMNQLLNYGTYAKAFFTGESVAATEEMNSITEESLAEFAYTMEGKLPEGIQLLGMSLILESETTIRMYFNAKNAIDGYTFMVAGKAVEANVAEGYYYLEVMNISAKDLDTAYTFVVSDGADMFELTYSALSYAKSTFSASDTELVKLAQALYLYNQAANGYFEN